MEIGGAIGAPHVERVLRARCAHHAEINEELLGLVEIGRLQSAEGDIADFDDRHGQINPG